MDELKAKQQVVEKIKEASKILVTVSDSPSVDALSAALGLTMLLDKQEKYATAIFSGETPPAIAFLEPEKTFDDTTDSLRDFIIALNKEKADHLRYKVEGDSVKIFITPYKTTITQNDLEFSQGDYNVELVIALGVDNEDHLDKALETHGQILHDATVITMTAGAQASDLGGIDWHDASSSSLSEMVTGLAEAMKEDKKKPLIDGTIATALLTGIVAATDRFSNEHTSSKVMTVAANLMTAGADQQLIATELQQAVAQPAPQEIPEEEPEEPEDKDDTPKNDSSGDLGSLVIPKDDEPKGDANGPLKALPNETLEELDKRVMGEEKAEEKAQEEIEAIEEAEEAAEKRQQEAIAESKPKSIQPEPEQEPEQEPEPAAEPEVEPESEQESEEAPEAAQQTAYGTPVAEVPAGPALPAFNPSQAPGFEPFKDPTQLDFEETEHQPASQIHSTYAPKHDPKDEPMFGGVLNATANQAEEDARRQELEDQNKTILSHSYIGEPMAQPSAASGEATADGFPGTPPVAPGSVGVNDVSTSPQGAYGASGHENTFSGLGGERVIQPLHPDPSAASGVTPNLTQGLAPASGGAPAPTDLGLPMPPPLPDFSQGIAPPPALPTVDAPQGQQQPGILGDILGGDGPQDGQTFQDPSNAIPAPGSAYAFEPEPTEPPIEPGPAPSTPPAPGQFQIPGQR